MGYTYPPIHPPSHPCMSSLSLTETVLKSILAFTNLSKMKISEKIQARILNLPKSGLEGQGCSSHLQNQDREPKLRIWLYNKQGTISKSRLRSQTPVRSPKSGLKGHE